MSSYVHHQSPLAPLFAGCPRRPNPRSAPRGPIDHHLLRDYQDTFRPECPICSRIGPLCWGGVFIMFAFPPRGTPQPRSPMGPRTMPDCAPISGKLKRKCIIFFIHVCSELKFILDRDGKKQTPSGPLLRRRVAGNGGSYRSGWWRAALASRPHSPWRAAAAPAAAPAAPAAPAAAAVAVAELATASSPPVAAGRQDKKKRKRNM